jgi:hypothetical protein
MIPIKKHPLVILQRRKRTPDQSNDAHEPKKNKGDQNKDRPKLKIKIKKAPKPICDNSDDGTMSTPTNTQEG